LFITSTNVNEIVRIGIPGTDSDFRRWTGNVTRFMSMLVCR